MPPPFTSVHGWAASPLLAPSSPAASSLRCARCIPEHLGSRSLTHFAQIMSSKPLQLPNRDKLNAGMVRAAHCVFRSASCLVPRALCLVFVSWMCLCRLTCLQGIASLLGLGGFMVTKDPTTAATCLGVGTTMSGLLGFHMTGQPPSCRISCHAPSPRCRNSHWPISDTRHERPLPL